jgi:hypothetical protein
VPGPAEVSLEPHARGRLVRADLPAHQELVELVDVAGDARPGLGFLSGHGAALARETVRGGGSARRRSARVGRRRAMGSDIAEDGLKSEIVRGCATRVATRFATRFLTTAAERGVSLPVYQARGCQYLNTLAYSGLL